MVALKKEALQHLTIALVGMDTCGLIQLLTMFFGTGAEEEDPFNFLDGAPLIKQPLPLISESFDDDEASTSASTSSKPSTSTAATAPRAPRIKKQSFDDLCDLSEAIIMLPLEKSLHETGIPANMLPARDKVHRTPKGGSLYLCRHPRCAERPYSGDLPGYGSHFRRVHLGICLGCPYCPNRRYWNSTGWLKHMKEKHPLVWIPDSRRMGPSRSIASRPQGRPHGPHSRVCTKESGCLSSWPGGILGSPRRGCSRSRR